MKRILLVLLISLFACFGADAQSPTFVNRTNGTYTPVDPYLSVPKALYIPRVCDTINALQGGKDTLGAVIFDKCNHKMYVRDTALGIHYWKELVSSSTQSVEWCNITNSGADPTGIVDASTYVQSLIDAGCRYIYLPKGQYLFSNTIQMKDSVTIKGDGRNNTVIKLATNIPAFHVGQVGQYSQFLDFDIAGTKTTGATTAQEGIFSDSATIYVNNVGGYDLGGFGIRFKHDLYNRPYPFGASLIGSIVSDCNFEKCYGGIKIDTSAEYIGISNTVMVSNTYGIHVIGGNSRISNCNMSANSYGIYMTYGGNGHHGVATNNNINHCTYNIYIDSVTLGYSFVGNMIYAGVNQLYIQDSKNIEFLGGDIVGSGTATLINDSLVHFTDVNMRTAPTWSISGEAPTITRFGNVNNSISQFDPVNNKQSNITYLNDSLKIGGNLYMFIAPTARVRFGAATTSTHKLIVNSLDSLSGTNKTNIASGIHLSNGISNTFHDRDTVTSTNINNTLLVPAKVAQFQKRFVMNEDGLTFSSKQSVITALAFNATNNANLNSGNNLQPVSLDAGLFMNQISGFLGVTTYSGTPTAVNAPAGVQARFTSTNNGGGVAVVNNTGFFSGLSTTIEVSIRDTLDKYTAVNTGSKSGAFGTIKTFYHHYMHTNPGQVNWGIYQEGATAKSYFQGALLAGGDTLSDGIGQLQVTGKATITVIDSTDTPLNILYQEPSTGEIKKATVNLSGSATLDFPNTVAGASSDLTVTVTGAVDGDVVAIGVPNASTVANGCFTAWVSAANTVTIRYANNDVLTAYDPASGTFKVRIIRH